MSVVQCGLRRVDKRITAKDETSFLELDKSKKTYRSFILVGNCIYSEQLEHPGS
jgi:hypothetical protein